MRADPGHQLARRERLGQVVVGAGIEPLDARLPRPARAEADHGVSLRSASSARSALQQREAVEPRHHDVGEDQIGALPARRGQRLLAVGDRSRPRRSAPADRARRRACRRCRRRQDDRGAEGRREAPIERRVAASVSAGRVERRGARLLRQPAQRFLHEGLRTEAPPEPERARRLDAVGRADARAPNGSRTRERRASPERARRPRSWPPCSFDQLLHQRQPDAGAFVGAPVGAFDPMEALEQPRQLVRRQSRRRYRPLRARAYASCAPQAHRDLACEGELESVGEQVEHDLLPHLPIDIDRLVEIARNRPRSAKPARSIAERKVLARSRVKQRRSVGSIEACTRPASMREKSSSELTSFSSRSELRCASSQPLAQLRRQSRIGAGLLERPEHQRERGAKLVADIGEERGLGAIDLGQGLGAPALRLVRPAHRRWPWPSGRRPDRGTSGSVIERAARTDADDQKSAPVPAALSP